MSHVYSKTNICLVIIFIGLANESCSLVKNATNGLVIARSVSKQKDTYGTYDIQAKFDQGEQMIGGGYKILSKDNFNYFITASYPSLSLLNTWMLK